MATDQLNQDVMQSIIKRYPRSRSAIMPLLHYVQSVSGYVTNEGIELISDLLDIETAEEDVPAEPLQEIGNQRVLSRRSKKLKL